MKVRVSKELNTVRILLTDTKIEDSIETDDGIVIDYDAEGHVVGMEFLDATKSFGDLSVFSTQTTTGKRAKKSKLVTQRNVGRVINRRFAPT